MIDIVLIAILAGVSWCVASEGFAGALQTAIICIISGLLAMNFFEPAAVALSGMLPANYSSWADAVSLIGLYAILVTLMRLAVERVAPGFPDTQKPLYEAGRWGGAFISGYVTMAFLLTAFHTAPVPRDYLGFTPERNNLLDFAAPDRQWLGFTQYVSEKSLKKWGNPNIFDGPQMSIGNSTTTVWASFPIRYATRRENIAASEGGTTAPVRATPPPANNSQNNRRTAPSGF
ncbi:MAG: CvpA family protein [Planctomycetaceae bacterium]|nr:CvpA family protein [Planctomycetaceae bacterium]